MLLELEKRTTVVCEALILPILILLAGFAPGRATPFTVTLFATNVVPAGILSTKITLFAATFPLFVTLTVYVNTSLSVAVCKSTDFCKLTFARFTVVCTVFEEAVLVIGGLPTKGRNWYDTIARFEIGFGIRE